MQGLRRLAAVLCVALSGASCATAGARSPRCVAPSPTKGELWAEFTVDSTGVADMATFRVLCTTHPSLEPRVRKALPKSTFLPSLRNGAKVTQVVQQPFVLVLEP